MFDLIKSQSIGIIALVVVVLSMGFGGGESYVPEDEEVLGSNSTSTISNPWIFSKTITTSGALIAASVIDPVTTVTSTTTLTAANFGETIYMNTASGSVLTLPAATAGASLRFVLTTAFDTANIIIDSAEGDNIEGTLHVVGGYVPCVGEDQINLVSTAETIGDGLSLHSNGTSWFIDSSMGSSTGSMTCTDPS